MTNTTQSAVYIVLDRPTASRPFATLNSHGALDKDELETVNSALTTKVKKSLDTAKSKMNTQVLKAFLWVAAIVGWGAVAWVYHLHPHFP
jgi:hypothetical protein